MNFLRSFALVAAIGVRADDVCQRRRLGSSDRTISSVVVLNNVDSDLFNIDKLAHVEFADGVVGKILDIHVYYFSGVRSEPGEGGGAEVFYEVVTDMDVAEFKATIAAAAESGEMDDLLNGEYSSVLHKATVDVAKTLEAVEAYTVAYGGGGGGKKKGDLKRGELVGLIMGLMVLGIGLAVAGIMLWQRRSFKRRRMTTLASGFGSGAGAAGGGRRDEPDEELVLSNMRPAADQGFANPGVTTVRHGKSVEPVPTDDMEEVAINDNQVEL